MAGGGEGDQGRGLRGGGRGRPTGLRPASRPDAFGDSGGGAVRLRRLRWGRSRRAPPLCLLWAEGDKSLCDRVVEAAFPLRLRLAAGSRHYSGRHFCWSALPGRRELRKAAVPPGRRWPGSPGRAGGFAQFRVLCLWQLVLPPAVRCRFTLSLFLNGISQGDLAR